ncbi:MAG: PssD/Cps14F family polysaccharide biosynthesis glycosyltransferase [Erysipelotrichaceae bacterium]
MKKVMFISSTGGHLVELLQLKPLFEEVDWHIVSEKTKSNEDLIKQYPGRVDYLVYGTKKQLISYLFKFAYNCIKSFYLFIKIKPDVIITTGTHTAVPMCYIAHYMKKKVVYIETFANQHKPTEAGKLVYPIADLFVVQWSELLVHYPNAIYGGWIF